MTLARGMRTYILLAVLAGGLAPRAEAQKQPIPPPGGTLGLSSVKFEEDTRIRRVLQVARDCIADKEWKQAVQALQAVLDEKKDYIVRVDEREPADPKKTVSRWVSAKFEANNLLGELPADGRAAYEKAYGPEAQKLLLAALKKLDLEPLPEIAQRYRHTKAGAAARKFVAKTVIVEPKLDGWPSWRGNVTNTGQAVGGAPLLDKPSWSRPILLDKLDGFPDIDPDQGAKIYVDSAIREVSDRKQPVLPGFFPVATRDVLLYRSQRDIRAVAINEITYKDFETDAVEKIKAGHILWKAIPMNGSLSMLMEKPVYRAKAQQWLDSYKQVPGLNSFLYENTLLGTLSADDQRVYAINDLAVPPHPMIFQQSAFNNPQFNPQELKPLLMRNELVAYDILSGKLRWDLSAEDLEFKNSHFLSVPISVGGKLYVLNEKLIDPAGKAIGGESELRLVCIDPVKLVNINGSPKPTLVGLPLVLGRVVQQNRMVQDMSRRVHAAAPAYADGVLVCPTNAGEVFGIDLDSRSLAWSYSYRESPHEPVVLPGTPIAPGQPKPGAAVLAKWKPSPPVILDGKLVFTAPDADSIHCVQLRDGKPLWRKGQHKGDLYLAGVLDGRVLIVGESGLRALDLKNGNELWTINSGSLPTGQGVLSKSIYYLPNQKGIVAIDVLKGQIKAHIAIPAGAAAPGNLVFYGNQVLSLTPTDVSAYPLLAAKLK